MRQMKKRKTLTIAVFLLIVICAGLLLYPALCRNTPHSTLQMINDSKNPERHLVVVTHGWFEKGSEWPRNMAEAINFRIDPNIWSCAAFDWKSGAMTINPADAAEYARDKAGAELADEILKLNGNLKHVHLIGHSSGCWAISEAAKILAKKTKADIHLTFFDAYVPACMDANGLGNIKIAADVNYWADHYYTRDYTADQTAKNLIHAYNIDVTEVDQFIKDHNFPWKWYYATITGSYPEYSFMDDKKIVTDVNGLEYGFARSLEAAPNAWQQSLELPLGNQAVKLKYGSDEQ